MPSLLSATTLIIPLPVDASVTGPPEVIKLFPAASFACTVMVTVSSVVTAAEETVMVDVLMSAAPMLKVIVGLPVVMVAPLMVAVIVTVSTLALVIIAL